MLFAFAAGRYHNPRIEERALLFIDMRASTAIAERLGELRYLSLLNLSLSQTSNPAGARGRIAQCFCLVREAYSLAWSVLVLLFRSRVSLEAEILILRHQLNIQRRHVPKRVAFSAMDRLIFVGLYRCPAANRNAQHPAGRVQQVCHRVAARDGGIFCRRESGG